MAVDSQAWGYYFSGRYAVQVDGVLAHAAKLMFTPNPHGKFDSHKYCLAVTLEPEGAGGHAEGFFHLTTDECRNHPGNFQKANRPLDGGFMQCNCKGTKGESGFMYAELCDLPGPNKDQPNIAFVGQVHQQAPEAVSFHLKIVPLTRRRKLGKYPWLP